MNVLFDIQHPAQVHLFKNAIWALDERGHETMVTSREKEVTLDLLGAYDIEHVSLSRRGEGLPELLREAFYREARLFSVARSFRPDVIVSRLNPAVVHVSKLLGCRNLIFEDTNHGGTWLGRAYYASTLPFVDVLCGPPGLGLPVDADRLRTVAFQELAYLHPDRFTPDRESLESYGVAVDEPYSVLRLVGWDAFHDIGHHGLGVDAVRELVSMLSERGPVYLSGERDFPEPFGGRALPVPPHLVHDLLYHADLYVGDSGTMSSEAAMLGTPAVRVSSTVGDGDAHTFVELERTYDLLYSFSDEQAAIERAVRLFEDENAGCEWARKRATLAADQGDVAARMVRLILDGETRRSGVEQRV
jgi:hypothetical protein